MSIHPSLNIDLCKIYLIRKANDLHSLVGLCPAGDHAFLLLPVLDPDLAVQAVAVPAEIGLRDRVHRKVLKTPQERVVLGHLEYAVKDLDRDKAFVWCKNIRIRHFFYLRTAVFPV